MSDEHFNRLRPEQTEALALVAEECGEVVHVIGKILRHGLDRANPFDNRQNNRQLLAGELGDLRAAVTLLESVGVVFEHELRTACSDKLQRVSEYLHHIVTPRDKP